MSRAEPAPGSVTLGDEHLQLRMPIERTTGHELHYDELIPYVLFTSLNAPPDLAD
jgi:hypothetical protein